MLLNLVPVQYIFLAKEKWLIFTPAVSIIYAKLTTDRWYENIEDKAIAMMRRKSPRSENILY